MVASGRKRSRRAPIAAPSSPPPPPPPAPQSPPQLTSLLALLASSVTLALRFASDRDLLLRPSQTLELDPLLLSAARAVSRLLAQLPLHLQTLTLTSLSLSPPTPSPPLPSSWFLRLLSSPSLPDSAWRDAFHMSKPAFFQLLHALALPAPAASSSSSSLALPPDHKLGAALFRLAHAAPARAVARRFGLPSPAVAARAFYEVCRAIAERLSMLLDLAAPDRIARAVPGFCALSLPNCCGTLGYTRFGEAAIAQALVDAEGRFLDVSVGWDPEMAPAEILPRTKLYTSQSMVLANAPQGELIGGSVPRYFLGPACCPLLPWLVTPYKHVVDATDDLSKESIFNHVHAHGQQVVKNAFGRVRARWRLLEECWKGECQVALPYVVVAGCLLHNFLLQCGEPMTAETQRNGDADVFVDFEGEKDKEGERIRDVLAAHLSLDLLNDAEQRMMEYKKSIESLKKESKYTLDKIAIGESDLQRGRTDLRSTRKQIQALIGSIYKAESTAAGLMDRLRTIPTRQSLQLRAEVASMASDLKNQRYVLQDRINEISEYYVCA